MPTHQDFQAELERIFLAAQGQKHPYVDVNSGELHRIVGGYPGHDHRMPVCCSVMRENLKQSDEILREPPQSQGATLTIRYKIPR